MKLADALASGAPESSLELPQYGDSRKSQPRRGGTGVSPGRKPGVESEVNPSPVGTAQALANSPERPEASPEEPTHSRDLRIVLAETEHEATLSGILRAQDNVTSLSLAVGPQGGWTADELQLFQQSHWIAASLGRTILRAETAAIAALAIARAEV